MKKKIKAISKLSRRLSVFDWLVIIVLLSGLIFTFYLVSKEERWTKVVVKVTPEEWWRENKPPPQWLTQGINKGDQKRDGLGRRVAEVLDIWAFEWKGETRVLYVSLNLKAEVDKRQGKLKFNHQPLEIGNQLKLDLDKTVIQGLLTFIEGVSSNIVYEDKVIEGRVFDPKYFQVFPETIGIMPWQAEAIKVGDQVKDIQGRVIAEVLDKKVKLADKVVVASDGRVFVRQDPIKKDVTLTVKLKSSEYGGVYYFLDDFKVKIGSGILLTLPDIDVLVETTRIIE